MKYKSGKADTELKADGRWLRLFVQMISLAVLAILPFSALAQGTRGTISGKVLDQNGAAIAGATAESFAARTPYSAAWTASYPWTP